MSMIKRLLALDGVNVICHFRDDGSLVEGYGLISPDDMWRLAQFAHDYRRMIRQRRSVGDVYRNARLDSPRGWIAGD